jgi:hypothetical protein
MEPERARWLGGSWLRSELMLLMVFGMGAVGACAALCRDDGEHGAEGGSKGESECEGEGEARRLFGEPSGDEGERKVAGGGLGGDDGLQRRPIVFTWHLVKMRGACHQHQQPEGEHAHAPQAPPIHPPVVLRWPRKGLSWNLGTMPRFLTRRAPVHVLWYTALVHCTVLARTDKYARLSTATPVCIAVAGDAACPSLAR